MNPHQDPPGFAASREPRRRAELARTDLLTVGVVGGANLAGAVLTFVYLTFLLPVPGGQTFTSDDAFSLWVFVAYMSATNVVAFVRMRMFLRPILAWRREGRRPTDSERDRTLLAPRIIATHSFQYWIGAAVVFGLLNMVFDPRSVQTVRIVAGILLGGLTTTGLCYVMVERVFRPVFAEALADSRPHRPPLVGLRTRLVVLWVLGSGLPLAAIGLSATLSAGAGEEAVAQSTRFLAAAGLVAGAVVTVFAAKALADPIESVRRGLERVEAGDTSVEIAVDSPAEVGLLQAGFNQMVEGLRERRRLQDLFGRHVGEEVARRAVEHGAGLGGEKLEASVLFVDLVGSTSLAERLSPEEVLDLLNAFFEAVVRSVAAESGWVNKFEGDGAMCVFGAPDPMRDHAARALRAACSMRADLRRLTSEHPGLDAGIGVSAGSVVAGNIGAAERYEYTVIGDPVNEASRLTEAAKTYDGRVLASARAVREAGDEAGAWRPVGCLELRGRTRPTDVYEPVL